MASPTVRVSRSSRVVGWCRQWGFVASLAVVFLLAFGTRLGLSLRTSGGLFGLGNYDDGVHFAAALGLVNGRLPYRDFLLLHPPGVLLCLAPFAALSWLVGEPWAMATARLSWMLLGGLNAVFCGLALRPIGRVAGVVGGLFYALSTTAVYGEYTALLESPATSVLLLALILTRLLGSSAGITRTHYLAAGALLGMSPTLKIWGLVLVIVVVASILLRRGRQPALLALGAAAAACSALCLPFFLASPGQMWRMVVIAQLSRRRGPQQLTERFNDILGVRVWVRFQTAWQPVTVVVLLLVVAAVVICVLRSDLRVAAALLLASVCVVLLTPMWFLHYTGLTAAPLALVVGGAVGAVTGWSFRVQAVPWAATAVGSLAVVGIFVLAAPLHRWDLGNVAYPGRALAADLADKPGCLATDWPMTLVQMNRLQANLDRGCPLVVDLGGYSYYQVDSAYSDVSRRRNREFQAVILDYYRSAAGVIPVRFSTASGYSPTTAKTISSWPVVAEADGYTVREPRPAAR